MQTCSRGTPDSVTDRFSNTPYNDSTLHRGQIARSGLKPNLEQCDNAGPPTTPTKRSPLLRLRIYLRAVGKRNLQTGRRTKEQSDEEERKKLFQHS